MILQRASDSFEDNRVVFSPLKNNDGVELGKRSAWEMRDGGFFEADDSVLDSFDAGAGVKGRASKVTIEHLREVFDKGQTWLKLKQAAESLMEIAGVARTTAYDALKTWKGPFSDFLRRRDDNKIGLVEDEPPFPKD